MAKDPPLCVRLPPDLHAAVASMASAAGLTTSEWVRGLLNQAIYGDPLNVEAGYFQGRQIGFRMMQRAFAEAYNQTPPAVEDALKLIQQDNEERNRG